MHTPKQRQTSGLDPKLSEIALGAEPDVDLAVKAARRAYEKIWSRMPGRERGKYLYRIARIIQGLRAM